MQVPHLSAMIALQAVVSGSVLAKMISSLLHMGFSLFSRFEINFLCDRDDKIAFHFNPRFTESDIICNSYMANHWGQEERCSSFPLGIEEPFQVIKHNEHICTDKYLEQQELCLIMSEDDLVSNDSLSLNRLKFTLTMTTSMFTLTKPR